MQVLRMMAVGGKQDGDPGPMVTDYAAQGAGRRSFHGRVLDTTQGSMFVSTDIVKGPNGKSQVVKVQRRNAVFVPSPSPVFEVPENDRHVGEYLRHLRDGDLIPADLATAQIAGVKFDPTFAKSLHRIHAQWLASEASKPKQAEESAKVAAAVTEAIGKPLGAGSSK
jgi:hypothetical protein